MPVAEVQMPDGRIAEIEIPEGMSPAEVSRYLQGGPSQEPGIKGMGEILPSMARGALVSAQTPATALYNVMTAPQRAVWGLMGLPTLPRARGTEIAETIGLEEPTTALGRASELAGASLAPGAATVGLAARTGRALPTLATELLSLGGASVGQEVAGPVGAIAGGLAPQAAGGLLRQAAATSLSRAPEREVLEAFQRQQVPATVGDIAGVAAPQRIASLFPGGYGAMAKTRAQQAEALENAITRVTDDIDDIGAGEAIQTGIKGWVSGKFNPKARKLYAKLDAFVPATAPAKVTNSKQLLSDITEEAGEFADLLVHPTMRGIAKRFEALGQTGGLTFQQLRQLRSAVGRKLTSDALVMDLPRAELKRLYGAISKDVDETAALAGPDAQRAVKEAGAFWKKGMERIDSYLDPLSKRKAPEEAFQALQRYTQKTPTRAIQLAKSLKPKEREKVISAMLRKIGEPVASVKTPDYTFSPQTFMTNLNKIDEKAWKALAKDTKFAGRNAPTIEDLRTIAGRMREVEKVLRNPSGTAPALTAAGTVGGGMAGLVSGMATSNPHLVALSLLGMGTATGGSWAVSKLMSTPGFVNWVAQGARTPLTQMPSQLGRLEAILAEEDEDVQQALKMYRDTIEGL